MYIKIDMLCTLLLCVLNIFVLQALNIISRAVGSQRKFKQLKANIFKKQTSELEGKLNLYFFLFLNILQIADFNPCLNLA